MVQEDIQAIITRLSHETVVCGAVRGQLAVQRTTGLMLVGATNSCY
jgi:hypothetical protein